MMELAMKPVSPYLQRPLRTLREACFEIARARGDPPPPCRGCTFERRCLDEARCLRRERKKQILERAGRTASRRCEAQLGCSFSANSRYIRR